jgi:putative spermidine/putrescine transport system substrate-binding protein
MRKRLSVIAVVGVLLTACSSTTTAARSTPPVSVAPVNPAFPGPLGAGEGRVNVLAWPGYVEDGSTDPGVDWVSDFERSTGCRVNARHVGSSDEAVALMAAGGWDVVSASGDATLRLIREGSVQPINTELLTHYDDLFPDLVAEGLAASAGATYGVPQGRAVNALLYDPVRVDPAPRSWALMYEQESSGAGRLGSYDSPVVIADAAVYLMGTRPDLGITDPFSLDQAQFAAALEVLRAQEPMISTYWSDHPALATAFEDGSVVASMAWPAVAAAVRAKGIAVASVKPSEGATGWSDSWMIARGTPNITCAYRWIDWMASPEVNAAAAEWLDQAPANRLACEFTADENHCATSHAADEAYWRDVHYWTTPTRECLDGRTDVECVPYDEWAAAWRQLRG